MELSFYECQTVWIQIRPPDLGPNCLQRLSADKKVCAYARKELKLHSL